MGQIQQGKTTRKKYMFMLLMASSLAMTNGLSISALNDNKQREMSMNAVALQTKKQANSKSKSATVAQAKVIASFSTKIAPGHAGRTHNIKSSTKALNNIVLQPGESLNYSEIVQKTKKSYGLKKAPVIVNGKFVEGYGGGICQTSSTLYNAALLSGLEIVERRSHSLPVGYVGLGRDATYADNSIEFTIRNHTEADITIQTNTDNSKITISILGQKEEGVSYEIKTRVLKKIQPKTVYKSSSISRSKQTKTIQKGKPGYVVETKRIKKKNGVVVAEELMSKSNYRVQNTIKGRP
ncbi:VanW family protein [Paenibacillus sp. SC116]|uniref:VanW family protein n=1 Tax=Paenibacillus sp. SC116 TaxID=2968986 RepID=UPI00215AC72F|nr:VanW family protein [Paenibacillus sp. SC116]MCR8842254.1 VanW family protein [Paenibacillus sp. SC116]